MPLAKLIFLLLFTFLAQTSLVAEYRISGKLNLKGEWQHLIYLATIDKLDDYYSAKAEHIINMANIDNDGNFELRGENLPDHAQFYKLYLVREEHSEFNACLYVGGENHNFIHIILDNETDLRIEADQSTYAPFGDYTIQGNSENNRMKELSSLVYPSYMFYEIRFPSELQFSQNKLNKDLFHFADTCSSTLVSLAALNMTDFDAYMDTHIESYTNFKKELKVVLPNHPYTRNYGRKLRYFSDVTENGISNIWKVSSFLLFLSTIGFAFLFFRLKQQNQAVKEVQSSIDINSFTQRELKILELIVDGKSNKEIARQLFIELSTVKSHINKLYSKMGISNRQEAKRRASSLLIKS